MPKTDRMSQTGHKPSLSRSLPALAPTTSALPDAARTIGLILSFARKGRGGVTRVPDPLLHDLARLSRAGDPTATLVSRWIAGRAPTTGEIG